MSLTTELVELARSTGAAAAGVTGVERFDEALTQLNRSIRDGTSGPLGFTYEDPHTATDIRSSLPWARSLFVFAVPYIGDAYKPPRTGPIVGRFATKDFYEPVRRVAEAVSAHLENRGSKTETLIDDNRLVDRSVAIRAGVGWLGKSTMVLTPGAGPWILLGSVATDRWLDRTSPMTRDCGTCTACIPACPTGALSGGALDARRCLSTWLQTPGSIPHWIRPVLGRRIYGCDDCLTSCPPGHPAMRRAEEVSSEDSFARMLSLSDDDLVDNHSWWFIPRRDGRFIRRNLLVAAGNSGEPEDFAAVTDHLYHRSSMIRGHAAWASARAGGGKAAASIRRALEAERTPEGREEMLLALVMLEQPGFYAELMADDERVTTDDRYQALGVVGLSLDDDQIPQSGLRRLLVDREAPSHQEGDGIEELVRVNDRERVLERRRRQARLAAEDVIPRQDLRAGFEGTSSSWRGSDRPWTR